MSKYKPQRRNRKELRSIFETGKLPTEASFSALIDSTINIIDDGINKSKEFGYEIAPEGKKLLSFFKNLEQADTLLWQFFVKGKENEEGIAFGKAGEAESAREQALKEEVNTETEQSPKVLFFDQSGNIGVHTYEPLLPLSVNGFVGLNGRIGTASVGEVAGDKKYHTILENVEGPQAYEIVARIKGPKGRRSYAMTHAIATCTYGGSWFSNRWFNKVRQTNAFYGWPWNRIKLKWKRVSKDSTALNLQIRTRTNYGVEKGEPFKIQYHITKLWAEDEIMKALIVRESKNNNLVTTE